jgi:MarR family transcriptional regulator, negative regulator of the multidrug operon emrRAB
MSHAYESNVLGAFGLVLADRLEAVTDRAGGASAAAALASLYGTRAGVRIDSLATIAGISHSGAVRLVDRLVANGLVERRSGADQRSAALYLTPAGRRTARRILAERQAAMHSLLTSLTVDQQARLTEIAAELLALLGSSPEAEGRLCRLCDLDACGRSRGRCPVAPARTRRAVVSKP